MGLYGECPLPGKVRVVTRHAKAIDFGGPGSKNERIVVPDLGMAEGRPD